MSMKLLWTGLTMILVNTVYPLPVGVDLVGAVLMVIGLLIYLFNLDNRFTREA